MEVFRFLADRREMEKDRSLFAKVVDARSPARPPVLLRFPNVHASTQERAGGQYGRCCGDCACYGADDTSNLVVFNFQIDNIVLEKHEDFLVTRQLCGSQPL